MCLFDYAFREGVCKVDIQLEPPLWTRLFKGWFPNPNFLRKKVSTKLREDPDDTDLSSRISTAALDPLYPSDRPLRPQIRVFDPYVGTEGSQDLRKGPHGRRSLGNAVVSVVTATFRIRWRTLPSSLRENKGVCALSADHPVLVEWESSCLTFDQSVGINHYLNTR